MFRLHNFPEVLEVKFHMSPEDLKSLDTSRTMTPSSSPFTETKSTPTSAKQVADAKINFSSSSEAVKKIESIYDKYNTLKKEYLAFPSKAQLNKCRSTLNDLRNAVTSLYEKIPSDLCLVALTKFILQEKIDNKAIEYKAKVEKHGIKSELKILLKHQANLQKLKERIAIAQAFYAKRNEQEPQSLQEIMYFEKAETSLIESAIKRHKLYNNSLFSKKTQNSKTILNIIAGCHKVHPNYTNSDERAGYNPAYQHIDGPTCPLAVNEKRIWVLRGDLKMATGIKNYYRDNPGATKLADKIDPRYHRFIDFGDRYGHPTLSTPEYNTHRELIYDGSVYHAGWMSQRSNYIEMLLFSGRFQNRYLSSFQQECVEIHIAKILMSAYDKQTVVFNNFYHHEQIFRFLDNDQDREDRVYTPEYVDEVTELEKLGIDITPDILEAARKASSKKNLKL